MDPNQRLFANPPVVEVVLGVQFAPLPNFTSGHLGWFWREFRGADWVKATDAPPLPDQFEVFGRRRWIPPGRELKLGLSLVPPRLQIANRAGDRLLQLQPTQFIYNWQRKESVYPSFDGVYAEFAACFRRFLDFAGEAGLGEVAPNQWEVTYVDQIPAGELWRSPSDWHRIFPGLLGPRPGIDGLNLESAGGEWHYELPPHRGRLHLALQQGAIDGGEPVLLLQTTVRGPIGKESGLDLEAGLNLGHEVALRAFTAITSEEVQRAWGRRS
jgi:uncharacterized protein (TIGR04255 family)